jgi:hypothetical protein
MNVDRSSAQVPTAAGHLPLASDCAIRAWLTLILCLVGQRPAARVAQPRQARHP